MNKSSPSSRAVTSCGCICPREYKKPEYMVYIRVYIYLKSNCTGTGYGIA
jgi:hypothetical protein